MALGSSHPGKILVDHLFVELLRLRASEGFLVFFFIVPDFDDLLAVVLRCLLPEDLLDVGMSISILEKRNIDWQPTLLE